MNKTILIAPFEGPLAAAIAQEARNSFWSVVIARPQGARPDVDSPAQTRGEDGGGGAVQGNAVTALGDGGSDLVSLPWNPASYVSASALILGAKNAFGDVDAVVILSEAEGFHIDLVGGKPGEVEATLHRSVIGPALLVRELLRSFEARKAGSLVLVEREIDTKSQGPAGGLVSGAFRGLGDGVFAAAKEAAWEAYGILDKGESPADSARFVLRLLEERKNGKSGRWLRFTGKGGLFGIF